MSEQITFFEEDFTLTTTGNLSGATNATTDESGAGWLSGGTAPNFVYQSDGSGLEIEAGDVSYAYHDTDYRCDAEQELHFTISNGSQTGRVNGRLGGRSWDGNANNGLLFYWVFTSLNTDANLRLLDVNESLVLKEWDVSALAEQVDEGDDLELVVRYVEDDIVFYSLTVNGTYHLINDAVTLTGVTEKLVHGGGCGRTQYFIGDAERVTSSTGRLAYYACRSLPQIPRGARFNPHAWGRDSMMSSFWSEDPDLASIAHGAEVTTWKDRGPRKADATADPTGPNMDRQGGINGLPSLHYDGDATSQRLKQDPADISIQVQPITTLAVYRRDETTTGNYLFDGTNNSTRWIIYIAQSGKDSFYANSGWVGSDVDTNDRVVAIVAKPSGDTSKWFVNGQLDRINTIQEHGNHGWDGFTIGDRYQSTGNSQRFNGRLYLLQTWKGNAESRPWWGEYMAALKDHLRVGTAAFDPTSYAPVQPTRAFWAGDADLPTSHGELVGTWADRGSDGINATNGVPSSQPTVNRNGINGRPTLSFNGTDQYLESLGGTVLNADYTAAWVFKYNTIGDAYDAVGGTWDGGSANQAVLRQDNSGRLVYLMNNEHDIMDVLDTDPHVFVVHSFSGRNEFWLDGRYIGNVTDGEDYGANLRFGSSTGTNAFADCEVGLHFAWDGSQHTEDWFAGWHGKVLDHYHIAPAAVVDPPPIYVRSSFHNMIPMLREFWAEDPDWTNPGDGGTITSWRDNGTLGDDLNIVDGTPTYYDDAGGFPGIHSRNGFDRIRTEYTDPASWGTHMSFFVVARALELDATNGRYFVDTSSGSGRNIIGHIGTGWRAYNSGLNVSPVDVHYDHELHLHVVTMDDAAAYDMNYYIDGDFVGRDSGPPAIAGRFHLGGAGISQTMDHYMHYCGYYSGTITEHADYKRWLRHILNYYRIRT